ncbi:MAG: BON domain-containing protein [Gammaproteobacteria bacterium]
MNNRICKSLTLAAALAFAAPLWAADNHSAGEILDDTLVTTKVKSALVADPVTKAHQISVDTYKGVVKLSGNVDSAEAEKRAVEVAQGIEGVTSVEDHLSIRH